MKKFLITDDEHLIRYSLAAAFQDPCTEILAVDNGKAALEAIQSSRYDLCFLDIHLPDMSGMDIMKKLRCISPWTRILIITGSVVTEAMLRSIREHAHGLVSKPFDLEQVKSAVNRVLTSRGPLYREDGAAGGNGDSCIQWVADDVRKHDRRPIAKNITCYAVAPQNDAPTVLVTADVVDISESGMCLLTTSELRPGHLLQLNDAPPHGSGVVRWSAFDGATASYWAGIQFVAPENISQ